MKKIEFTKEEREFFKAIREAAELELVPPTSVLKEDQKRIVNLLEKYEVRKIDLPDPVKKDISLEKHEVVIRDLVSTIRDYMDWVDGVLFDHIKYNEPRHKFANKFREHLNELRNLNENYVKRLPKNEDHEK